MSKGPWLTPDERAHRDYIRKRRIVQRMYAVSREMFTVSQAAKVAHVSVSTIYRWISQGMPAQVSPGDFLIDQRDLRIRMRAKRKAGHGAQGKRRRKRRRWDM